MYYGIASHKTFIQKPYQEGTSQLGKHMQRTDEERKAFEVRHPPGHADDPGWKAAIIAKVVVVIIINKTEKEM